MSRALIKYWSTVKSRFYWCMDPVTREMITATITELREADKARKMTRVERETNAILKGR